MIKPKIKKLLAAIYLLEDENGHTKVDIKDQFEALVLRKACLLIIDVINKQAKSIPKVDESKILRFKIEKLIHTKHISKEDETQYLKDILGILQGN